MDPNQRFTAKHPCPVCGGHRDLPSGDGHRCWGFSSDDDLYAHCVREQYAGHLDRNGNSDAYPHYLQGDCACGEVHGAGSAQARRLPEGSQNAPSVSSYRVLVLKAGASATALWRFWRDLFLSGPQISGSSVLAPGSGPARRRSAGRDTGRSVSPSRGRHRRSRRPLTEPTFFASLGERR